MTAPRSVLQRAWKNAEKWLGAAAVVLALVALGLSWWQLRVANRIAWDYDGGAQCSDYRGQVLELWKLGLAEERIRDWFSDEVGGQKNAYGETSPNALAIDDFEHNCGTIAQLLSHLPPKPPAS